ncbi:MAG: DUF3276 family protein [Spirochaetales bacterium]|jgi:hypothetical protein|nr:DUF3276 family protein [Spirochaetales bacterium]
MGLRGEIYSERASSGKRTYFFNVKENRHGDVFLNIVESKKNTNNDFERYSLIVFEEDLDVFLEGFKKAVKFIRER